MADHFVSTPACANKSACLFPELDFSTLSIADLAVLDRYAANVAEAAIGILNRPRVAASGILSDLVDAQLGAAFEARDLVSAEVARRRPAPGEREDWLGVVIGNLLQGECDVADVERALAACAGAKAA